MSVRRLSVTAQIILPDTTGADFLNVLSCPYTQDEGAAPYLTMTMTIAAPALAVYAKLAPEAGNFVELVTSTTMPTGEVRDWSFIVGIDERSRNADGTVDLALSGPERDLIAYSPSDPATARQQWAAQESVWFILENALRAAYGLDDFPAWADYSSAGLEGVSPPAPLPFRTYESVTNLVTNGGFEYGTAGWAGAYANIAQSSTQKHSGTYSMSVAPSTTNQTASRAALVQNLQPATTYTLTAWIRTNGVMSGAGAFDGRKVYVTGAIAGSVSRLAETDPAPNVANQWNQVAVTFTTPSLLDAGSFELRVLNGTTTTNGVTMWVDDIMLVEGDGLDTDGYSPIPYFDGDTPDGRDGYNYDWQGSPGNSSSTRTPVIDRSADSLTWLPGTSAWDFVQPILQATGTRLFSTGYIRFSGRIIAMFSFVTNQFAWRGYDPARFVEGESLYDIRPLSSRTATFPDGTPMFADQVIVHYTWTDSMNVAQEAYDAYPATGKSPWLVDVPGVAYAGKGRAQGLYKRLQARAQQVELTGPHDPWVIPGMQVTASSSTVLGGSILAYVDASTHDPIAGTVTVRTKQAIDYPTSAWAHLPVGQRWSNSPAGATWSGEVI